MYQIKINFEEIDNRVHAAWKLQDANRDGECKAILLSLAKDILKKIVDEKSTENTD